jgi:lysophospholipase L1-like esterase
LRPDRLARLATIARIAAEAWYAAERATAAVTNHRGNAVERLTLVGLPLARREVLSLMAGASVTAMLSGCGSSDNASDAVPVLSATGSSAVAASAPPPTPPTTSFAGSSTIVVQAGDSIGIGVGADYFAAIEHLGFSAAVGIANVSVGGRKMLEGYQNRQAELFPFYDRTKPCILVIQLGTNDLGEGRGGRDLYESVATPFVAAAKAAGFYVVINTVLPRSNQDWTSSKEAQRQAYNALVRSNAAAADAVDDWAADPVMGDAAGSLNTVYYADGLHPTVTGQQRLVVLDVAALQPFLQRQPRQPI